MTDYLHHSIFPAHLREENGRLVEGIPERNQECQWPSSREVHDPFDYGYDGDDMDWETILPADPFGMDINSISSTVNGTITGLLEYLEADYGGYGNAEVGVGRGDSSLLNVFFNKAIDFHPYPTKDILDGNMMFSSGVDGWFREELSHPLCESDVSFADTMERVNFDNVDTSIDQNGMHLDVSFSDGTECVNFDNIDTSIDQNGMQLEIMEVGSDSVDGTPHPAMSFALGYLGVSDLLSVGRVCKSLQFEVQNPILWMSIHIDSPLSDQITDDVLVQLTRRAQGYLQCLSLVGCQKITDDGLKHVLESNLRMKKLSVPGCTRLSIDGIVNSLRAFKMVAVTGIKYLRIGGLYGVTQDHYEDLMSLMGFHNHVPADHHKPPFYYKGDVYPICEDDRPIDIEMCCRCQNYKLVYDCPADSCQGKGHASDLCRACIICIPRCHQCGKCINDGEYHETFCLRLLCLYCHNNLVKCQNTQDIELSPENNSGCEELVASLHG